MFYLNLYVYVILELPNLVWEWTIDFYVALPDKKNMIQLGSWLIFWEQRRGIILIREQVLVHQNQLCNANYHTREMIQKRGNLARDIVVTSVLPGRTNHIVLPLPLDSFLLYRTLESDSCLHQFRLHMNKNVDLPNTTCWQTSVAWFRVLLARWDQLV